MTIEQLRDLLNVQPFRPFRVHLADGRAFQIEHPEFLAQSKTGRTIVVLDDDDTFEIIDLLLATNLETVNGKPKRRPSGRSTE